MKTKLKPVLALVLGLFAFEANAQLVVGETAPDFTFKDTKGTSHTLYSYLNAGKPVIVDAFATWCGPCWSYHNKHYLDQFHEAYGPTGTNQAVALGLEGEYQTNTACLSGPTGCNDITKGDWLTGTKHPTLDPTREEALAFNKSWKIAAWPTILMICPDKKIAAKGQLTLEQWKTNMSTICKVTPRTSTLDAGMDSHVSVYPNLSSGSLFVDVSAAGPNQVSVDVYNAMGETVISKEANASGSKAFKFDLSAQRNGFYFVKVKSAAGVLTRKIVLEK
jgi:thiol-disulfide isomerase/thioredoxin